MRKRRPGLRFFLLVTVLVLLGYYLLPVGRGDRVHWPQIIRPGPVLEVEKVCIDHDQDGDGILDLEDIVLGARAYVETRPRYQDGYYQGGYPPPEEGVCTDVIWAALAQGGYDLKRLIDEDIRRYTDDYPRVQGRPEPNIDFRRVKNLEVFFQKYAEGLTTEVMPGDLENLREWQGGDIVVFGGRLSHIAIVSDRRRSDGVPLILHNSGPHAREEDRLLTWPSPITHHFRFPGPRFLEGEEVSGGNW